MKTRLLMLAFCLLPLCAQAETASYGVRLTHWSWQESKLYGDEDVKMSGMAFGPTLLFRVDPAEKWSIGLDGLYGMLDDMDRADVNATAGYAVSSMFTVFAELRYQWFDADLAEGAEADGTAWGPGLGVAVNAPLGESGFHLFASTRISPMFLDYSAVDAPDTVVQWHYEGGLGYAFPVGEMERGNLYASLGYRFQQMRASDLDEQIGAPFCEVGFRQMF